MNLSQALDCNLILVTGKGGVGKSTVSEAIATGLSQKKKNVLYVTFEDPQYEMGARTRRNANLMHLNGSAQTAFEEYVGLKIGLTGFARVFLQNRLIQYLAKIAPGLHDLVLLGQVWFERDEYDHVVVDMPSTGYTLSMFHGIANYAKLFRGGPIHRDAEAMLDTFSDPKNCVFAIVSLAEEMPLRESLELEEKLKGLFPKTRPAFIVNRLFPEVKSPKHATPEQYKTPLASDASEYLERRFVLERENLKALENAHVDYARIPFIPSRPDSPKNQIINRISEDLKL